MKKRIYLMKCVFFAYCFLSMTLMFPFNACAQVDYKVEGHVNGLTYDIKVFLLKESGEIDSTVVHASVGDFSFHGSCPKMTYAAIVLEKLSNTGRFNKQFTLFLDGITTRLNGAFESFGAASLEGSALNADVREFEKQMKLANSAGRLTDKAKAEVVVQYIAKYPSSYRGLMEVYLLRGQMPVDRLKDIYGGTSSLNKKSPIGKLLQKYILSYGMAEIGKSAPDFSLKDLNGNTINLRDYRGKYVLMEFWSGYCVPCRTENPLITSLYAKYRSRGLEVIGMGLDTKDDLIRWGAKDGNTWNSVVLAAGLKDGIAAEYNVLSIPYSILIDKKGNIIARGLRESQEDEKLKVSTKLNEIFSREEAGNSPR